MYILYKQADDELFCVKISGMQHIALSTVFYLQ